MDPKTIEMLREINNVFYEKYCDSFSSTRQNAWPGWRIALGTIGGADLLGGGGDEGSPQLTVFDLGCGNLRFETFLAEEISQTSDDAELRCFAVDNCDDLVPSLPYVSYQHLDVIDLIAAGEAAGEYLDAPPCDLSVSFGFLHHVPTQDLRKRVMESLIAQTLPGGYVVISFWQFLKDEELHKKAEETHARGMVEFDLRELDENDYLLGWKKDETAYRYCHNFSEDEIDWLVDSVAGKAPLVSRFASDGRTGDMNTYVVLRVL